MLPTTEVNCQPGLSMRADNNADRAMAMIFKGEP